MHAVRWAFDLPCAFGPDQPPQPARAARPIPTRTDRLTPLAQRRPITAAVPRASSPERARCSPTSAFEHTQLTQTRSADPNALGSATAQPHAPRSAAADHGCPCSARSDSERARSSRTSAFEHNQLTETRSGQRNALGSRPPNLTPLAQRYTTRSGSAPPARIRTARLTFDGGGDDRQLTSRRWRRAARRTERGRQGWARR